MEPNFPMPQGFLSQYEFIRWLQTWHNPLLERILHYCTWLGTDTFYIVALPVVFWAINKRLGLRLAYIFLFSMYINGWLKDALKVMRPIGIPGIVSTHTSTAVGYAMPSGHAQGPMTFWTTLGRWVKRVWFWILAMLFVFAIGFSRVYFGLHWPLDVVVGWVIGLVVAVIGWWVGEWWTYRKFPFQIRIGLAVAIPAALIVLQTGQTSLQYASLLLGIGVGAVLEEEYFKLELPESWLNRVGAVIIGIAGLIALQWLIKWPSGLLFIALRDVLTGLWCTLGAPYVFHRCGLYHRSSSMKL